ncbi:MAG: esterase-like activity of phytase family protein [Chthoniobacter sp.]|nr:esterase-like activity of phytase family protein [Chthoniobacter sp.]
MHKPTLLRSFVAAAFLGLSFTSLAQYTSSSRDILVPNTGTWSAGGVSIGGTSFVVKGLQGVGRIASNTIDGATGESFGSFSAMQITGFTNNNDGSWSGTFNMLPDRGYNSGAIFSNYAARINSVNFTFTPYTSNATTVLQNQIAMTFAGSQRFTYDHDNNVNTAPIYTTGLLATGSTTLFGNTLPIAPGNTTQSDGTFANRLTLDAEALVLRPDGSGYIGDEYGARVYHFNASKQIDGVLGVPEALVPHSPVGTPRFDITPLNGRRDNQGFEGVAASGNKLFTMLQSATIQDSGSGNQNRANAVRLMEYDISGSATPSAPSKQYVIQLPRIDDNGGTPAVNRAGAQSELIAINDHQLLILSRDGNGRGASGSPVFKSILLADVSLATDITGFAGIDAEGGLTTTGAGTGVLSPSITPISWTEALNMLGKLDLGVTELEQFGLNLNAAPGNTNTISEKWEAMSLVSAQDPLAPNDYFLFVGNDNDFLSGTGQYLDAAGNLQSYNAGLENDNMVLAYRVTMVPEPGSIALLAGTAAGLLGFRRRRAA